jgi:hypothetical protein
MVHSGQKNGITGEWDWRRALIPGNLAPQDQVLLHLLPTISTRLNLAGIGAAGSRRACQSPPGPQRGVDGRRVRKQTGNFRVNGDNFRSRQPGRYAPLLN